MGVLGKQGGQYTSIGGQAVLEGVMMRSPRFVATAVRRPDLKITIKHDPYSTILKRYPILAKPVLRGVATLIESMVQGMGALSFSAQAAGEEEQQLSKGAVIGSMAFAFLMGIAFFVVLPHALTAFLTSDRFLGISASSPLFHLIDGVLKMAILMAYIYGISLMKDIERVFQYHGAEHKSIHAFEAGLELTVENARPFTTKHPRCGTSFLLFLVLVSVGLFSILLPVLGLTHFSANPVLNHAGMIVAKIVLMFPVAGVAYEFIKICACRMDNPIFRAMIAPGMLLQKLTTREPDDAQLEVALASLRQVLRLEKAVDSPASGFEITELTQVAYVPSKVAEFLER